MAIPASLRESLHSPVFWALYFFADEADPLVRDIVEQTGEDKDDEDSEDEDSEVEATFDVGGGYKLLLEGGDGYYNLGLATPEPGETADLGWDDEAQWHPHALRWSELDLICRAVAALDPGLPHPGPALALLHRFAAVFEDDDVPAAAAALDAAFASLRPAGWDGFWPSGAERLDAIDFRGQNVTWHQDEDGNRWASQEADAANAIDFFSLRAAPPGSDDFPHAQLRALLAAATATLDARPA